MSNNVQETDNAALPSEEQVAPFLLDLPMAKLQIVQSPDILEEYHLERPMLEPQLSLNADGLWVLSVRRQGEHRKFNVPFIGSEIMLADAELGLIVVLVGYHGSSSEKYGKLGYMTQKGQFYRYYRQETSGDWKQVYWRILNDELRSLILESVEESGLAWARVPGKLSSERKPPAKRVAMTSYKVVRFIDGRYFSLYDPDVEYVLGERLKQRAKPNHGGGFYSLPTIEIGTEFLASCTRFIPFSREIITTQVALIECEIGGRIINYGHKMSATYLCPIKVIEIRDVEKGE
jgi:hypothetical protein